MRTARGGSTGSHPSRYPARRGATLPTPSDRDGTLGLGDPAAVELDAIQQGQDRARLAGHSGTVDGFTVLSGETENWTATLSVPSGERTDFDAAALFTCQQDDQWYAFAGFEDVDDDDDNGGGGSLSMGSLGS